MSSFKLSLQYLANRLHFLSIQFDNFELLVECMIVEHHLAVEDKRAQEQYNVEHPFSDCTETVNIQ